MADNADALRVMIDGGAAVIAPLGTTPPTGMDPWGAGWRRLGLISDAGVTESAETERTERRPWGYRSPVRTDITTVTHTVALTAWETNPITVALHSGQPLANFFEVEGTDIVHQQVRRPSGQQLWMLGIDEFDGENHIRTVIPRCEVTQPGEIVKNSEEVRGYPLTFTAYELSDGHVFDRYFLSNGMWVPMQSLEITLSGGGGTSVVEAATRQATAMATPYGGGSASDVTSDTVWDTSDPAVATVDTEGLITGVEAGSFVLSATYRGTSATLAMTVTPE